MRITENDPPNEVQQAAFRGYALEPVAGFHESAVGCCHGFDVAPYCVRTVLPRQRLPHTRVPQACKMQRNTTGGNRRVDVDKTGETDVFLRLRDLNDRRGGE